MYRDVDGYHIVTESKGGDLLVDLRKDAGDSTELIGAIGDAVGASNASKLWSRG